MKCFKICLMLLELYENGISRLYYAMRDHLHNGEVTESAVYCRLMKN